MAFFGSSRASMLESSRECQAESGGTSPVDFILAAKGGHKVAMPGDGADGGGVEAKILRRDCLRG